MLTGRVPFDDTSVSGVIQRHLMSPVPSPREFNPNLSEDVDWVLLTALEKDPFRRFASCEQFYDELKLALTGLGDLTQRVSALGLPELQAEDGRDGARSGDTTAAASSGSVAQSTHSVQEKLQ